MDEITLKSFNNDELAASVFLKKYAYKDEKTMNEMRDRLTDAIMKVEKDKSYYEKFRDTLNRFLPAGRVCYGLGNDEVEKSTLSNCYVLPSPEDNLFSIFETAGKQAKIFSMGGGVGFDVSKLRPRNAKVNNVAKTSTGAISFMDLYSLTTGLISQNSRRGALMLSIDCKHPDLIEFINVKGGNDKTKVQYANISIRITDDFMNAVINDDNWEMTFTLPNGEIFKNEEKAKNIWDLIISSNWKGAEPGILFWDNIMKSPASCFEYSKPVSTNPCVIGSTNILTSSGYRQIKDCVGEVINIWNGYEWSEVKPKITGENQEIYCLEFSDGNTLECTPYHKFYLNDSNTFVEAQNLKINDKLQKYSFPIIKSEDDVLTEDYFKEYYTAGFFCGDGSIETNRERHSIKLYGNKTKLLEYFDYERYNICSSGVIFCKMKHENYKKDFVPLANLHYKKRLAWLSGIIDSDGCRNDKNGSISISSIDKDFLKNINFMLNTLGVGGTVSLMKKESENGFYDKKYNKIYPRKNCYRIVISSYNVKLLKEIGLDCKRVDTTTNPNRNSARFIYVTKITKREDKEKYVYCFDEKIRHKGVFNGILTGQCAEEPLPPYGSCNLGALNLSKYVVNSFNENSEIDFNLLVSDIKIATRFMNNVNLINKERQPLKENKEMIERTNAIGIGITGLADMLIKLNIKYDTEKALEIVEKVMKTIKENVVKTSIELAKERGCFKLLTECSIEEKNKFINHEYFNFLEEKGNENYLKDFYEYGIANIQFTTVAPTGSLSIIMQTSGSGIEPLFNTEYERTVLTGDEKSKKFIVCSNIVKEYDVTTGKSYKDNEVFVTASNIDWKKRIQMQSIIQKYISESISSTINLPNNISKDVISEIYMEAWKHNLKGITTYRDGCREGVLNNIKEDQINVEIQENVKFPESTNAKMRVIKSEGKKWYVTYTIDEETKLPNSLFVNTNSSETNINTFNVIEELKHLAKKHINHDFIIELENKTSHQANVIKVARFLSLLLRHRVPIIDIIKSIENSSISMTSFAYRIKGLLSEFIEGKHTGDDCPECKSKMIYQDGCKICMNCGWSKCG